MIMLGAGILALPQWVPLRGEHFAIIAGLGIAGALGQWAITEAFHAEPGMVRDWCDKWAWPLVGGGWAAVTPSPGTSLPEKLPS